nr:hypothetical protein [Bradyrhizobium vignae]
MPSSLQPDHLGIDPAIYNVHGGSISIGYPYSMTGARLAGHALLEGKRRGAKYVVVAIASQAAWGLPACSRSLEALDMEFQDLGLAGSNACRTSSDHSERR